MLCDFLHLSDGIEQKGQKKCSAQLSIITVAVFSPSVLPAPLIHHLGATEGCEKDSLTLDTVVSNSNEDSEQRQTKVYGEDIKDAAGDCRQPATSCF
jgi:hypothetical protein